jgi:nucleotide-binding universal stress UspA family protein
MMNFDDLKVKRILVSVDGSRPSREAARKGAFIARVFDAEVTLLCVVSLNKVMSGAQQVNTGGYVPDAVTEVAEEVLKRIREQIPRDIRVSTVALVGDPATVITEEQEEEGFDLIVMGSRGLGAIKGLFMGSVSQHVIKHAKCPVLIVR